MSAYRAWYGMVWYGGHGKYGIAGMVAWYGTNMKVFSARAQQIQQRQVLITGQKYLI